MQWQTGQLIHQRYKLLALKRDRPGHQVWLAFDQRSQAKVILKTLAFTGEIQWDEVKLFEREIEILQRLDHPRIPAFVDAFTQDQPYFCKCLVETYIHAPSLQNFLTRQQQIPEKQVWAIALQILEILRDLHRLSPAILHRDLKPSNILLDTDKTVYLIDLGAVGIQTLPPEDRVESPTTVGSYGYTPMEQFMGQAVPASDLYALGATVMQLLTATHPADLLNTQLRLALPCTCQLPPPLKQWLYQLTSPQLCNRIPTANQAIEALAQAHTQTQQLTNCLPASSSRVIESSTSGTITIKPIWSEDTLAIQDLLLLVALGLVPPVFGIIGTLMSLKNAHGLEFLGTELLLGLISLVPSLIIGPKLFWNLVQQSFVYSDEAIQIQWAIAGITIRQQPLPLLDIAALEVCPDASQVWVIRQKNQNHTQPLIYRLSGVDLGSFYPLIERWLT